MILPNITEILLILLIVFITFGVGKLPSVSRAIGKLRAGAKKSIADDEAIIDITPETAPKGSVKPRPGTRKEPIEDADIEEGWS